MLIDWTTVIFQIINFLILVALLKRFLYGPVIRAMDEREKTIAARLEEAARLEQEAAARASQLAADQRNFVEKREQLHQAVKIEIAQWKEESVERLQADIDAQQKNWQKNLEDGQGAFLKKLKITISRQVFEVSKKALAELADERLEARLLEFFLEKISREIETRDKMHEHFTIVSGFPLGTAERAALENRLKEIFPKQMALDFREEKELGFGIRLLAGDRKWEWNLNRYMNDIEDTIIQTMSMAK